MPKRRLGVVLLVPPPWSHEIDGLRRALGDGGLERIATHLTLIPPVNVNEEHLPDALDLVREAAAATRPFGVHLGPPRTFSPVNPVVYLAVEGSGEEEVRRLREAVFAWPLERTLTWSFVPHVTLVDEAAPERIAAALGSLSNYEIDVVFDRVHVLEQSDARTWHPVADAPFVAPAVIGRGGLELTLHRSADLDIEAARWMEEECAAHSLAEYGSLDDEPFAIVARRGDDIVGTATGALRGSDSYLARLVVGAAERGTGVGSHLLAAAESLAAEGGCRRMTLRTPAEGGARAFYEHRGWRVYAILDRWRAGRDFVQMERTL